MGNFLTHNPNIRSAAVASALLLSVGATACVGSDQNGDTRYPGHKTEASGLEDQTRYQAAKEYMTSEERQARLQAFTETQTQRLIDFDRENPGKSGLYFQPETQNPSSPPKPRHLGETGNESWGNITNFWGGGKGDVLVSAHVFMDADGQIDLSKGVKRLWVERIKDNYPTEGDSQVTITSPEEALAIGCLWSNYDTPTTEVTSEAREWVVEARSYDQYHDTPFGEWKDTYSSCAGEVVYATHTASELQASDEQAMSQITDLITTVV